MAEISLDHNKMLGFRLLAAEETTGETVVMGGRSGKTMIGSIATDTISDAMAVSAKFCKEGKSMRFNDAMALSGKFGKIGKDPASRTCAPAVTMPPAHLASGIAGMDLSYHFAPDPQRARALDSEVRAAADTAAERDVRNFASGYSVIEEHGRLCETGAALMAGARSYMAMATH
jgi:hypothetical protein